MTTSEYRVEHDSMGALDVPATALWGAQTQRAIRNFPASGLTMPRAFIRALGLIKHAAASANAELGDLAPQTAAAIQAASLEVAGGKHDDQFPGPRCCSRPARAPAATMNANEVIAALAGRRLGKPVHANDQVNMGQSSNDVIPTAIHVSAALVLNETLLPALRHLRAVLERRASELEEVVKTGRTHHDRTRCPSPSRRSSAGWRAQIDKGCARLVSVLPRLIAQLAQGGDGGRAQASTARENFGSVFARHLSLPRRSSSSCRAITISRRYRARTLRWSFPGSSRSWP